MAVADVDVDVTETLGVVDAFLTVVDVAFGVVVVVVETLVVVALVDEVFRVVDEVFRVVDEVFGVVDEVFRVVDEIWLVCVLAVLEPPAAPPVPGTRYQFAAGSSKHSPADTPFQPLLLMTSNK